MAVLCREIGLLLLQAPHTGSTSLGTLLRQDFGGVKLLEDVVRDGDLGRADEIFNQLRDEFERFRAQHVLTRTPECDLTT